MGFDPVAGPAEMRRVTRLDGPGRAALLEACGRQLPAPPFEVSATAWCAAGRA